MERETNPLTDAERLDWLRLARCENIGPRTFLALMAHYGNAAEALAAVPELARRGGGGRRRRIKLADAEDIEREIDAVAAMGGRLIALCEPDYPDTLAAIDDPPPLICVRGDAERLKGKCVAVVGARNASAAGLRLTRDLAGGLSEAGFIVVSGLARGTDTAAHQASLGGGTVAVMAGGLDVVYPPENETLYEDVITRGAAVSERPPGTVPTARHFPPRNRLISGLSMGILVVEAALRSGSLITARMALEQGREVFAVPGSPLDPRCRGANDLIRQGATLTESADDIVSALSGIFRRPSVAPQQPELFSQNNDLNDGSELTEARADIMEKLGPTPVAVDELVRECQLSASIAMTVLLELELAGRLERHPGHRVSLAP